MKMYIKKFKEMAKNLMMIKDDTLKEIENIPDNVRSEYLKWIIKNCSSYVVTPKGHEHWLFDETILTHWGTDTGYSRKYMGLAFPDNFESWNFNEKEEAFESFKTHYEMENN
jgi:hypothetical protein